MAASGQVVQVDGRRLRVTNLDKVVYPETGTTKGEILAYASRIAPVMLPHLRGRPITRKRWVDGVGTADAPSSSFFTKQLEQGAPDWIRRMPIEHSGGAKEYPQADDAAALVWFAQIAALELHVPQWRFTHSGERGRPDRLVLDLDPGPGTGLAECAEVARIARGILSGMGLDPIPVTSGSKGIHLYARLPTDDEGAGLQTSDDVSAVAKELARLIEANHPDLVTRTMAKSARGGKVFIDWSQNNAAKTTIAPYSLRGRARPWVAAPRTWDELEDPELGQLEFDEVLERVDAGIDPLAALALIRTGGEGEKSQWLLHRMKDAVPHPVDAPVPAAPAPLAASAMPDAPAAPDAASIRPMLSESGSPGLARDYDWAEIKWDGVRAIGTWADGRFTLRARSGTDITVRYPELTADGAPHLPASDAVVDGEIVAFDARGLPSFSRLQDRMHLTRGREIEREVVRTPVVYLLFDLMRLDGHDLTRMPLRQRRELLEQLASGLDAPVQVPPVFDDLDAALRMSAQYGLEGVVAKDPASAYRPGARSPSWLKIKHTRTQEAVIVGIRPGQGNRRGGIGSLLLAVGGPDGSLEYVGRVGTGFTDRMLRDLAARLEPLRVPDPPLEGVPAADASDALWVRPELVGEVEFANWSPGGILRHSRWRGLRADKSPEEVRRES
ncbi:non-homologous end-joining DNA ligase [uncultured Microbacterium sp.]|uniref:non-homologous end-joining DNA ligase n=1 Tax=uncultured Microbacterium sp. TaxID=191216 RepID=UPI00260F614D|nr:non-homologous end-joining DNA ligase [uncultured Microbacterium sp.]